MNSAVGVSSCTSCPSGMWSAGESTNSSSCVADTSDHCSVGSHEFSKDGVSTYANGPVCVAQNIYPADEVAHCVFEHTWRDVIWDKQVFRTGGLGRRMTVGEWEVWVCVTQHQCVAAGDALCFTYSETREVFVPWHYNSVLSLFT